MARCTFCGTEAIYRRPYSGEHFCSRCFLRAVEKRIRRTISKHRLLTPQDRIAFALSGGKDSIALLHIMNKLEAQFPHSELVAITIDEGITGYRSEALGIAKKCCEDLGVEHRVYSFQELYGHTLDEIAAVATRRGTPFICSYCGILRRKALNIAAGREKATKLATAHNLDDEVQSRVMTLLRGDLATMARVGFDPKVQVGLIPRVKPMCEIPERDVTLYAYLRKITFQSLPCRYRDTSLRSDVRRFLNQMEDKHPGMKFTLYRSFEKIRPHLKGIKQSLPQGWCEICGQPTTRDICMACYTLRQLDLVT